MKIQKSTKYISDILTSIYKESNINVAYNLGLAAAYSHLYEYIKYQHGKERADEAVKDLIKTEELYGEMLKEIIALNNEEDDTKGCDGHGNNCCKFTRRAFCRQKHCSDGYNSKT